MSSINLSLRSQFVQKIQTHIPENGVLTTTIPGLTLMKATDSDQRRPIIYNPCIYVVAQGSKCAYLEDETYIYDALHYLVLTVALPLQAHITQASKEQPYLAARLEIDLAQLNQLLIDMNESGKVIDDKTRRGISTSVMNEELISGFSRLIDTLNDEQRARVLGPNMKREIIYTVLQSEQGALLRSFSQTNRHDYQIANVIHYIQSHYHQAIEVADLADIANMSSSSLHQHFKTVTHLSPMQYIKSIRLHQAKRFIIEDEKSISDAAFQVGYTSSSQFSREYKRLFGLAPSQESRFDR